MGATSTPHAVLPALGQLRRFVTLVDLEELIADPAALSGYLHAFGPDEDATLLVHGCGGSPERFVAALTALRESAGVGPEVCPHAVVCPVEPGSDAPEQLCRAGHAVLSAGDADWMRIRRPIYGPDALAELRRHAERHCGGGDRLTAPYSYEAAIDYLVARGWVTEHHARMGSIPPASLARATEALSLHLPARAPRVLHVGNFVGVSLSYLLDWAARRDGLVVSIDPDLPHRGVEHPQRAVNDLLGHFGLTDHHLLVCGYSLTKNVSNDGVVFDDYDPAAAWAHERAPERALPNLAVLGVRFDAAFIDGNHDPDYLRAEIARISELLVPGGLLILDDVDPAWERIRRLFDEVSGGDWPLDAVAADGRIGILRRRQLSGTSGAPC